MGLWHFRRFSTLFLIAGTCITLTAGNRNPASAQAEARPNCLRIVESQKVDDRTLAVALAVKIGDTADAPARGKLHLYTTSSQYIVTVDRTPTGVVLTPTVSATPDPGLRVVEPAVVKIDSDVSEIKGLILESGAGTCRMSEWVISQQRPAAPVRSDILAAAHAVAPTVAPPATAVALECPVPFAFPHLLQAALVEPPMGERTTGTVQVLVDLDVTGHVTHASIKKSLTPPLNAAALRAAKESMYSPLLVACVSQPTTYVFVVEFQ